MLKMRVATAFNVASPMIFFSFSTHFDVNLSLICPFRICVYIYALQIQEAGFDILTSEERTMTEAEMRLFYQHRAGKVSSPAPACPRHSRSFLFRVCL